MIENLSQIGEREILNRLKKFMPIGQIEDDTAQLKNPRKDILISTDVLVEDVHFSDQTTSPEDVGWRAIATNLSDLASSGVDEILGITVGMIAPPQTKWKWVERVYKGMDEALKKYGGQIIGGDCSCGQQKILAITAIGSVGQLRLHRSKALDGDLLIATGPHGLSRLGLALLQKDPLTKNHELTSKLKAKAIAAHQRPNPPLKALKALKKCKPKGLPWRAAGTDTSDGLLDAIQNLSLSSNCQAVIDPKELPRDPSWPVSDQLDKWCLEGGEDFELILSVPPSWADAMIKNFPSSKKIGSMRNGTPKVVWLDGREIKRSQSTKFEHF